MDRWGQIGFRRQLDHGLPYNIVCFHAVYKACKHTKKSWRGAKGEALAWSDAQRTYDSARLRGARRRQGGHAIVTGGREEAEEVGTPRKVVVVSRAHNT